MTAGRGITHSEESLYPRGPSPLSTPGKGGKTPLSPPSPGEPAQSAGPRASAPAPAGHPLATPGAVLHGVQLWIALPRDQQFAEPGFAHYDDLPVVSADGDPGARVTVIAGEFGGKRSPAVAHTPLVGLQVALPAAGNVMLATRPDFEYGVLAADAPAAVTVRNGEHSGAFGNLGVRGAGATGRADGTQFRPGMLAHVPTGSDRIELTAPGPCRFMIVGGLPLGERLVMWWNFVARSAEEIASARESWIHGDGRFGPVHGYAGKPLPAPPLPPGTLKPRLRVVTVSSIRDRLQTRVPRSTLRSRKRNPLHGRLERYGA
jgi:redox-sensitive bicupin YhaK (pirin superfamily)